MMDGSVKIYPNGSPVVEQLWGEVGKVMSYTSRLLEPLSDTAGLPAEEQSPLCRILSSPTDLRDKFFAYLPRMFSFGDACGTAEPGNTNYEACDSLATSPESIVIEQVRMFADEMLRDDANSDEYSDSDNI